MSKRKKGPWYSIYRQVVPLLDSYEGKDSVNLLIQQLAAEHNYEPKVLSRMIKAGRFLDRLVGHLPPEDVRGGYAHIEYIQRLHELAPEEASSLVGMAISKKITLEALQAIIDKYSIQLEQGDARKRSKARSLISEHERNSVVALTNCGTAFFGIDSGEMIQVERSDVLGQFIIINDRHGQANTAIFSRLGDTSRKAIKAAAELLKLAKTARSYFEKVWFVFPESSELVHELAFLANEERLFRNWLHLSTLISEEETFALQEVTSLRHALSRTIEDGADPLAWSGHHLNGLKKPVHGKLIKNTYTFTTQHNETTTELVTDIPADTLKGLIGEATTVDVVYDKGLVSFVKHPGTA
ncbi:hypothetical protein EGI99_04580 [Stutzerimonas stutzeri]|jgi:hypothetical protein|nr:hypothetical protein EGI99_04580 [Stutzerimonas stutzeri]